MWRRYVRFLRPDLGRDVDEELAFHLRMLEDEYVARGMSRDEARRQAHARFGDVNAARTACITTDSKRARAEHRAEQVSEVLRDVRYGVRTLWHQRGFAAAVIVTLALGIGATTAMFSAVDAALLRPLPFSRPAELVRLYQVEVPFSIDGTSSRGSLYPDIVSVDAMRDVFSHVAAYASGGLNLTGEGDPERVRVGVVTVSFFATLGVAPVDGRGFSTDEGRPGGSDVTTISYGLWRRRFGNARAIGKSLELNGRRVRVVGVMPMGFSFPERSDLWIPMTVPVTGATFEPFRGFLPSAIVARLSQGTTQEAALARMSEVWRRWTTRPGANPRIGPPAMPLQSLQFDLAGDRRTPLLVLLGATALLLLIACVNVTNLLLARSAHRRREVAMRVVLGATRLRIVRQLLIESLVLSLAGASAGLAVALGSLGTVRALLPARASDVAPATLDLRVLSFAIVLAAITGVAFGLWPALGASRTDAGEVVKSGGYAATTRGANWLRRSLVAVELALALTLLSGAGLMLQSFKRMLDTDFGFRAEHVATAELAFGRARGSTPSVRSVVLGRVIDRLRAMPGVAAAGVVNDLPLNGEGGMMITVSPEGRPMDQERDFARYLQASEGYFHALGIPLIRGRLMTMSDDSAAPRVMVINETMARRMWPEEDAIGKRVLDATAHAGSKPGPAIIDPSAFRTVIGIVGDVRERYADAAPQMYFPVYEQPPMNATIVARGAAPNDAMLTYLRDAVRAADPQQALYNVRMMDEVLSESRAPRRVNTALMTAFASLALLLGVVGVYGVVAYGVTRRQREFGIRAALGATAGDLMRLAVREGAAMGVVGVLLGLAGSYAFTRVVRSLVLDGTGPTYSLGLAVAPMLLFASVLLATLIPARRASHVNPMDVIRSE